MYNYLYEFIFYFFIFSLCINTANASEFSAFPLIPRLAISGGTGNNNSQANADAMIPLFGNAHGDVYVDVSGQSGSDKTRFGSLGLGIRQTISSQYLMGAYGFIDRDQAIDNQWLVFNPGVEIMTNYWDGRINGYFPVGSDQHVQGQYFGDQIGLTNREYFKDHSQYDGLYNKETVVGTGVDADVGYTFSNIKYLRIHGGVYYFAMPGSARNIKGEEAGLDVPINKYISLSIDDSNDNVQHNTTTLALKFTVGNNHTHDETSDISHRLLEPIYRHFATLYNSSGIPESSSFIYTGRDHVLEKSHLWFFTQHGGENFDNTNGLNNCTYEHPCNGTSFNQDNINKINVINPGVNFYFNPGEYQLNGRIALNNSQSLYGRNWDYKLPASSQTGLPIFFGGLDLDGGNNHLDSVELLNQDGDQFQGISIKDANDIVINNVSIGQADDKTGFYYPLKLFHAQNIVIENSTINGFGLGGFAIDAEDVRNLVIDHNILNEDGGSGIDFVESNSKIDITHNILNIKNSETGISIEPNSEENSESDIDINDNIFNMTSPRGSIFGIADYTENSVVNLNNNIFNLNSRYMGVGMIVGGSGYKQLINADHNTFNINVTGDSNAEACGIFAYSGTINAEHNTFTLHSTGIATGIQIDSKFSPAVVNIQDNIFNFDAPNTHHEENNGGIINDLGGNQWNNGL